VIDRLGRAGLIGLRGKVGAKAADEVAARTRFDARTLRNLVGLALVVSRTRRMIQMVRRARGS
jgi:hypothetical protein